MSAEPTVAERVRAFEAAQTRIAEIDQQIAALKTERDEKLLAVREARTALLAAVGIKPPERKPRPTLPPQAAAADLLDNPNRALPATILQMARSRGSVRLSDITRETGRKHKTVWSAANQLVKRGLMIKLGIGLYGAVDGKPHVPAPRPAAAKGKLPNLTAAKAYDDAIAQLLSDRSRTTRELATLVSKKLSTTYDGARVAINKRTRQGLLKRASDNTLSLAKPREKIA